MTDIETMYNPWSQVAHLMFVCLKIKNWIVKTFKFWWCLTFQTLVEKDNITGLSILGRSIIVFLGVKSPLCLACVTH